MSSSTSLYTRDSGRSCYGYGAYTTIYCYYDGANGYVLSTSLPEGKTAIASGSYRLGGDYLGYYYGTSKVESITGTSDAVEFTGGATTDTAVSFNITEATVNYPS